MARPAVVGIPVLALALATLFAGCGADKERSLLDEPRLKRAAETCEQHRPPGVLPSEVEGSTAPTSAGRITELALARLGKRLEPWDGLPRNHVVAACGYRQPPERAEPECLSSPASSNWLSEKKFYVDGTGRWSPDPFNTMEYDQAAGCRYESPAATAR